MNRIAVLVLPMALLASSEAPAQGLGGLLKKAKKAVSSAQAVVEEVDRMGKRQSEGRSKDLKTHRSGKPGKIRVLAELDLQGRLGYGGILKAEGSQFFIWDHCMRLRATMLDQRTVLSDGAIEEDRELGVIPNPHHSMFKTPWILWNKDLLAFSNEGLQAIDPATRRVESYSPPGWKDADMIRAVYEAVVIGDGIAFMAEIVSQETNDTEMAVLVGGKQHCQVALRLGQPILGKAVIRTFLAFSPSKDGSGVVAYVELEGPGAEGQKALLKWSEGKGITLLSVYESRVSNPYLFLQPQGDVVLSFGDKGRQTGVPEHTYVYSTSGEENEYPNAVIPVGFDGRGNLFLFCPHNHEVVVHNPGTTALVKASSAPTWRYSGEACWTGKYLVNVVGKTRLEAWDPATGEIASLEIGDVVVVDGTELPIDRIREIITLPSGRGGIVRRCSPEVPFVITTGPVIGQADASAWLCSWRPFRSGKK